jgi:cyanophycinase
MTSRRILWMRLLLGVAILVGTGTLSAQDRLRPAGIDGKLLLCGKDVPESVVKRFVELAGGEKGRLVVLLAPPDQPGALPPAEDHRKAWQAHNLESVVVLLPDSRKAAEEAAFAEPLKKATAVWIDGVPATRLAKMYKGTPVEKELAALLKRDGVIAAQGDGATTLAQGFGLLPGTVVEARINADKLKPGLVGIGLPEKSALLIQGRDMQVLGEGKVQVCQAASTTRPPRTLELKPKALADLTQLRRAALARSEPVFPPKDVPAAEVPKGSLVIVGGGGMPAEITRKFIELAGGPDALIVVLPTANEPRKPNEPPIPAVMESGFLLRAGAKNVVVLPGRELQEVEDPKNLAVLKKARAIWFGGGRQWRFVDAYEGTKAHDLFRDVLRRGGVIGGSSAGATIQGDYLCRGSPLGNLEMMCEGYERGLGFLPGAVVDQHFAQRKRFGDMTAVMKTYPQLLGIGLDEATAIVVQGSVAEVMGRGEAHFYDRTKPAEDGKPDYESLKAGGKYDVKARKVLPG